MDTRTITWVVFDLGETLVDETRPWTAWAEYFDVPPLTFFACLGAVIADRRPHTDVFEYFPPGFDPAVDTPLKEARFGPWSASPEDLYADAVPTLTQLRASGYKVAVMANQPPSVEPFLASLPVDAWATSSSWGVAKPDPAFFSRMAQELHAEPSQIAYVGDRVDNDVLPAKSAGMLAIHLRRGPWGLIHATWPEAALADVHLDGLTDLPAALRR